MIFGAIVGAGTSLLGAAMSGKKGSKHKFRPFSMSSPTGRVSMDKRGMNAHESQFNRDARGFFQDQFGQAASDPFGQQQFGGGLITAGQQGFGPAFEEYMNANFDQSNMGTDAFLGAMGQHGQFMNQGGQMGIGQAMNAARAGGVGGVAGMMGQGLFGQGQQLMGQAMNQQGLIDSTKAQLDALAMPAEERAVNSKFQNLFGSGRLGTKGGAQALGALAAEQQQADLARSQAATQLGLQQQQNLFGQANNLFGQGFTGLGQNINALGLDQQLALGQGQLGQGLLGQYTDVSQMGLDALVGRDQRNISRAGERVQAMEGLFGFGQDQLEAPAARASRSLAAMDPLNQQLFNNQQLALQGAGIASGTVTQGANPLGTALTGFGSGLFNRSMDKHFGNSG